MSQEIHDKITDLSFNDCKVLVSNVDVQLSSNEGILIQVLGEMSNDSRPSQKFAQTFFLAQQEKGFYVLNDIFRYLKEDVDSEYGDPAEAGYEAVPTEEPSVPATAHASADAYGSTSQFNPLLVNQGTDIPSQSGSVAAPEATIEPPRAEESATTDSNSAVVANLEQAADETQPSKDAGSISPAPSPRPVEPTPTAQGMKVDEPAAAPAQETPAPPKGPMSWAARAAASKAAAPKVMSTPAPRPVAASVVEAEKRTEPAPTNGNYEIKSAFLKNVSAKMSDDAIKQALAKFGSLKGVEINRTKVSLARFITIFNELELRICRFP